MKQKVLYTHKDAGNTYAIRVKEAINLKEKNDNGSGTN